MIHPKSWSGLKYSLGKSPKLENFHSRVAFFSLSVESRSNASRLQCQFLVALIGTAVYTVAPAHVVSFAFSQGSH